MILMSSRMLALYTTRRLPSLLTTTTCRHYSKRYPKQKRAVIIDTRSTIQEAIEQIKSKGDAKPNHAVQLHVKCNVVSGTPSIRGTVMLPNKVAKNIRIMCFAEGTIAEAARKAGADIVGAENLLEQITADQLKYDIVICTPQCFPMVTKVARTLGPKGLMPNVKKGTVTDDVATIIETLRSSVRYTCGKTGDVHVTVGRVSFEPEKIEENVKFMMKEITNFAALTPGKQKVKRSEFVHRVAMSGTKGPGVPLRITQFEL